ncbi:MAG TPA: hypothetical protein VEK08_26705 [Planctomycetota bacterium]|nr:hypothetical protein [Planctomycetota bacterium]
MISQYHIFAAIIGVYVVSRVADAMVERNSVLLDKETRERIWQRETLTLLWWRGPDIVGIGMMILGICKVVGLIRVKGSWGIPVMAAGLMIIALSSIVRSWLIQRAHSAEAPDAAATKSAKSAALLVTVAELSLIALIGMFILAPALRSTGGGSSSQPAAEKGTAGTKNVPASKDEPTGDPFWVSEAEAVKMLKGPDASYLLLLVQAGEVRAQKEDGQPRFRRDDISQTLVAGLPSEEDLRQMIASKIKVEPEKPARKSEPKSPSAETQPLKE